MSDRYVLILAKTIAEGNTYAKRADLPRFGKRAVGSAKQIRGIKVADVHILPGFHERPDRHAILSELRYGRDIRFFEATMPPPPDEAVEDQGDGMGPQLTIDDIAEGDEEIRQLVRAEVAEPIAKRFDEIFPPMSNEVKERFKDEVELPTKRAPIKHKVPSLEDIQARVDAAAVQKANEDAAPDLFKKNQFAVRRDPNYDDRYLVEAQPTPFVTEELF